MGLTPIPQNYRNNVDWILGAYADAGVSFPNGFQKDAIQNAVGARKTKKWKNWHCDISVVENSHGKYVLVEDSGTVGLTGDNIPADQVNKMMSEGKALGADQRLARFTSMFNSGGNTTGGGLFGAGKSVYSVASDSYTYYFDSLREDGQYVSNVNKSGQVNPVAFEGDKAKEYIFQNTGFLEKKSVGTRIIIESPKQELVESIENGGIISFIQESWWLIIERLPDGCAITVNGMPVTVPSDIKKGSRVFELQNPEIFAPGYTVKHFGLYVFENGGNRWSGISYYRKGMKIGDIDIKDVPKKVEGKFWGYVEVDELWETDLAEIEDKVHFGVSKGKKGKSAYQNLKNYCGKKFRDNMVEWGFIKDREAEDKKLSDELRKIAEDVQDLFDKLGFEDLGKGPQKSDFDIRWQDIRYPVDGSEKVTSGDKIKFSFRIRSSYSTDKTFEYSLTVINPATGSVISQIVSDRVKVHSNAFERLDFEHTVTKDNSEQFAENRIILKVKVIGSGKEKMRELPFFFDIDKPDNSREAVNLYLHTCEMPTENSRRVNFGESVKEVSYQIENRRNCLLSYRLNISIHNASDPTCPKIVDIASFTGIVKPFEEAVTNPINEIVFDQSIYEPYLTKGVLELRARLIAADDDDQYEKGDKITFYHYKMFLNMDEKNGKNDSFKVESINAPEDYRRSWCMAGNGRTITLNVGHTAYLSVADYPDIQHEYLREQMLKQYVMLYLEEGKYDMFRDSGKSFLDYEPQEAADKVIQKIERVYYESLK